MTHPRTAIRAAAAARLATGTRAVEVITGRPMPQEQDQLPALLIHTRNPEKVSGHPASGFNGYTTRTLELVTVGCLQALYDSVDDDLDAFADEIEARFETWTIAGFESSEIRLLTTNSEVNWEAELPTGWVEMVWTVRYLKPYRECSNPYVLAGDDDIMRSGAYPGGRVIAGCPADNTGEACPIGTAELFAQGEPIN
jgi:hypothetical protein